MDAPAVANREILFNMQLLVLLRRGSLMEGATNNDAKLQPTDGMARKAILRRREGLLGR